jgi:hypothetical protein
MARANIGAHLSAESTRGEAGVASTSTGEALAAALDKVDSREISFGENAVELPHHPVRTNSRSQTADLISKTRVSKHRFGLPDGFVSRVGRYGRSVLLEDNVYRLPNGRHFIPQPPSGTLGKRNHQYALLTTEEYEQGRRGSVYVRMDGRLFDYASDHGDVDRELFDTGFTIHDLERTGHYAPRRDFQISSKKSRERTRRGKKR